MFHVPEEVKQLESLLGNWCFDIPCSGNANSKVPEDLHDLPFLKFGNR